MFVPFKYDLGGTVVDTNRLMDVLGRLHGTVTVDAALLRSWNLSYLAGHAPVVSCALPDGEAVLGGSKWRFGLRLRVYPWLGVASADYTFTSDEGSADLARFYDDLVEWKNRDYLPYLDDCQALTDSLNLRIPDGLRSSDLDLHGSVVRGLRSAVADIVEQRPVCYAFHDFRMCFVGDHDALPDERIRQLLWLSGSDAAIPADEHPDPLRFGGLAITSTRWSTVVRADGDGVDAEVESVVTLLNLIHAQWYVCQLWINTHDPRAQAGRPGWKLADAHVLSANQSALEQDLSEIDNLNVMLKDPGTLRIARYLEEALKVRRHKETAMQRLHALENHSRQLADHTSEMELRRFQALFAISAAAGIASLVPALAQVGFSNVHVVTTLVPLFGFWILFGVDFSAMRQRWRTRRRRP